MNRKHTHARAKIAALTLLLVLGSVLAIDGTLAFLMDRTSMVENIFNPSEVECKITESFTNNVKSNVNVSNIGDVDAYVRVRLVTYRVNASGERIGGTATIPSFTLGSGWEDGNDGYYYYTSAVKPGKAPANQLIGSSGIELKTYTDADGGKQVIEVLAEAIQASGMGETGAKASFDKARN